MEIHDTRSNGQGNGHPRQNNSGARLPHRGRASPEPIPSDSTDYTASSILNARRDTELRSLRDLSRRLIENNVGPGLHMMQGIRLKVVQETMAVLLFQGKLHDLLMPPADSSEEEKPNSLAFKIMIHLSDSTELPDAYIRDILRAQVFFYPASSSNLPQDVVIVGFGEKSGPSIQHKHRMQMMDLPQGEEMTARFHFVDAWTKYMEMRDSGIYSDSVSFRALGELIEQLNVHMTQRYFSEAKLHDLALRSHLIDEPRPPQTNMSQFLASLKQLDTAHRDVLIAKTSGKILVSTHSWTETNLPTLWRIMGARKKIVEMSQEEFAKEEERTEEAMKLYSAVQWPLTEMEARKFYAIVARASSASADPTLLQKMNALIETYLSTEISNLSRNKLVYAMEDRLYELALDVQTLLPRLEAIAPEKAISISQSLFELNLLILEITRASKELDLYLMRLRAISGKINSVGDDKKQRQEFYSNAMAVLCQAATIRSELLAKLRDAHVLVRGLKPYEQDGIFSGLTTTLDTIRKAFDETRKCTFREDRELIGALQSVMQIVSRPKRDYSPTAQELTNLRYFLNRTGKYGRYLAELERSKDMSDALERNWLVKLEAYLPSLAEEYAKYEKITQSFPPLYRELLEYLGEREENHANYRYLGERPHLPRSRWLIPDNVAERMLLRINFDRLRGSSKIAIDGKPLMAWESEVREIFTSLTEENERIVNALLDYSEGRGQCQPIRAAQEISNYFSRRNTHLEDEYPSRKHYGAQREKFLHIMADFMEDGRSVYVRVRSGTISESSEKPTDAELSASPFFTWASPLEIKIDKAHIRAQYDGKRLTRKPPEEVVFGPETDIPELSISDFSSNILAEISERASVIFRLQQNPAGMQLLDRSIPRPLNGAIAGTGPEKDVQLILRSPLIVGDENNFSNIADFLFGNDTPQMLEDLEKNYGLEARATVHRASLAAIYAWLPVWLIGELEKIEKKAREGI